MVSPFSLSAIVRGNMDYYYLSRAITVVFMGIGAYIVTVIELDTKQGISGVCMNHGFYNRWLLISLCANME